MKVGEKYYHPSTKRQVQIVLINEWYRIGLENVEYNGFEESFEDGDTIIIFKVCSVIGDYYEGTYEDVFFEDFRKLKNQSKPLRETK